MEALAKIQQELKAPKNQYNKFGNFYYRNAEDIMEALKPILAKEKMSITTPQKMIEVGGRIYVETTATITDSGGNVVGSADGHAREAEAKKGMDDSQVTGSAASYSKKAALGNLLAIDDTKDADATNTHGKEAVKQDLAAYKKDMHAATSAGDVQQIGKRYSQVIQSNWNDKDRDEAAQIYQARIADFTQE